MSRPLAAILAGFVTLASNIAIACSCMAIGTFEGYARGSAAVIHARVKSLGPRLSHGETLHESMRVEVVSVIAGNLDHDTVMLLGDPGFMCRDYVDSRIFVIGSEFLIALHNDAAEQPFGGCGEAWVVVNGDRVEGAAYTEGGREKYSLPLKDVIATLSQ